MIEKSLLACNVALLYCRFDSLPQATAKSYLQWPKDHRASFIHSISDYVFLLYICIFVSEPKVSCVSTSVARCSKPERLDFTSRLYLAYLYIMFRQFAFFYVCYWFAQLANKYSLSPSIAISFVCVGDKSTPNVYASDGDKSIRRLQFLVLTRWHNRFLHRSHGIISLVIKGNWSHLRGNTRQKPLNSYGIPRCPVKCIKAINTPYLRSICQNYIGFGKIWVDEAMDCIELSW